LTAVHTFYDKANNPIGNVLGTTQNELLTKYKQKLSTFSTEIREIQGDGIRKEQAPILTIIAPPRTGKSLMLTVLGRYAADELGMGAVGLTYNSNCPIKSEETFTRAFWTRVLSSAFRVGLPDVQPLYAIISLINAENPGTEVMTILKKYLFGPKPIVILADEFSSSFRTLHEEIRS
jgi:hypothetical protein